MLKFFIGFLEFFHGVGLFLDSFLLFLQNPGKHRHDIHGTHAPAVFGGYELGDILGDETHVFVIFIR